MQDQRFFEDELAIESRTASGNLSEFDAELYMFSNVVYYKTKEECEGVFKMFKIKELALVNLYTQICLEALIGKNIY